MALPFKGGLMSRDDIRDALEQIHLRLTDVRSDLGQRIDRLNQSMDTVKDQVGEHRGWLKALQPRIESISRRVHDVANRLMRIEIGDPMKPKEVQALNDRNGNGGENRRITMRDVYVFVAGIAALWVTLKAFGIVL